VTVRAGACRRSARPSSHPARCRRNWPARWSPLLAQCADQKGMDQPGQSLCSRKAAHQKGAQKVDGRLLLQRWINRTAPSLLGSANLVRPGLRPNGPSNIASRHRLGDHNDRAMHPPQVAETPPSTSVEGNKRRPISLPEGKTSRHWRDPLLGGAPSRAHVWTDPGALDGKERASLEGAL
jgi:hypothetical protein